MALEAEFLSHLQHPHIIKIRGITHSGVDGFSQGPKGFFLIIDSLHDTLDNRIKQWRKESKSYKSKRPSFFRSASANFKKQVQDDMDKMMDSRLSIALQISAAMKYLHSNSIMFRDLKPCNIGFDGEKLFNVNCLKNEPLYTSQLLT